MQKIKKFASKYISVFFAVGVFGYTNSQLSMDSLANSIPINLIEDGMHAGSPIYYKKRSSIDQIFNDKRAPSSISSLFQNFNEPSWR